MQRDIKCEARIRPMQKPGKQDQVSRTGYREKLGKTLYGAEDDGLENVHTSEECSPGAEEILKLDESCISKIEIRNLTLDCSSLLGWSNLRFRISIFEMQDSSNFKMFLFDSAIKSRGSPEG